MNVGDLLTKYPESYSLLYEDPWSGLSYEELLNGTLMILLARPERIQQILTHGAPGDLSILCKVLLDDGRIRWVRKAHVRVIK